MHPPDEAGLVVIRVPQNRRVRPEMMRTLADGIKECLDRREPMIIMWPKEEELEGWEIEFHSRTGTSWPYQVLRLSELVRK